MTVKAAVIRGSGAGTGQHARAGRRPGRSLPGGVSGGLERRNP